MKIGDHITAVPAGTHANGEPITTPRAFVLARPIEYREEGRSRVFDSVWIPDLQRYDAHPHIVLTDSIKLTETTEQDGARIRPGGAFR